MEFSNESVVFFKPQNMATNLLVASKNLPLMVYFSFKDIPVLTDYFKIILSKARIVEYIRKLEKYLVCDQEDKDILISFLLYAKELNKDIICSVPIISFDKKVFSTSVICFGNFKTISTDLLSTNQESEKYFPVSVNATIINGKPVNSPCEICKLNSQKIGDICMYRTTAYDCLFNCDVPEKEEKYSSQTTYETTDMLALDTFLNTSEGEKYK